MESLTENCSRSGDFLDFRWHTNPYRGPTGTLFGPIAPHAPKVTHRPLAPPIGGLATNRLVDRGAGLHLRLASREQSQRAPAAI
jgi:hypothetical protein